LRAPERLVTQRLVLRRWRDADVAAIAKLNADPHVMRFFLRTYGYDETKQRIGSWSAAFEERGYAPWAVELTGIAPCIGFVGIALVDAEVPLAGSLEVVWRLDGPFWGQGYAVEAAQAAMRDAFERLRPEEIVAYTAAINTPSKRVMEKLGMAFDAQAGFEHPRVPDHRLRPHVVYRMARRDFLARHAAS
jgi:RimJ/RimL family protein N-acetyltransferase